MNAKELAEKLSTARTFGDLHPLAERMSARRAAGHPVALEEALAGALHTAIQIRDRLADRLRADARAAADAIRQTEGGYSVHAYELATQANYTAVVHAAELEVAAGAAKTLLDVFAAIGDRVVATPEEHAKAAADREAAQRRAAWEAMPTKDVKRLARRHGLDEGRGKASLVTRLSELGIAPETEP